MTAPDPNGCKRCGAVECPARRDVPHENTERAHAGAHDVTGPYVNAGCPMCDAIRDCWSRPAVDWQAECRRLASRPAPVEVRGVVTVIPGDFTVTGAALVCIRVEEQGVWLPAWPGARVGQGVTVAVTPDDKVRREEPGQ